MRHINNIINIEVIFLLHMIDLEETLLKTEQYLCPANRNHKLQSLDKLLSHLHTCKEVKLPDQ